MVFVLRLEVVPFKIPEMKAVIFCLMGDKRHHQPVYWLPLDMSAVLAASADGVQRVCNLEWLIGDVPGKHG